VFRTHDTTPATPFTLFIRYGVGAILTLIGVVLLIINPGGFGVDGFALGAGVGLSVLMLNWMFRVGVAGDEEREHEEEARRYLEEHGYWPDEARSRQRPPATPPAAPPRPPAPGHRSAPPASDPHARRRR
jgi:hypothetical protein